MVCGVAARISRRSSSPHNPLYARPGGYEGSPFTLINQQHHQKGCAMTAAEKILAAGYEDVVIFENYSYDDALIGVTEDGRAVYDFDKMVRWLVETEGFTAEEAIEWIEYNTIRALGYMGEDAPIIMYPLEDAG